MGGDEVASRYCIVHLLCCRNGAFASLVREIDGNIPSLARDLASAIMHCAHAVDKSVCSACAERLHEPLRDVPIWLPAGDPRKAFRHLESALRNARSATGASVGLSVEKLFAFAVEKMPSAVGGKALDGAAGFLPVGERAREKVLWNAPRRCIAKLWTADPPMAPPSMLPSIAADFPGKPENPVFMGIRRRKGKSRRHFHGHSRSAGFLWKSCWQTVPEAGRRGCPGIRPTRGLAGRDRPAVLLRTAVDILWIKLLAKCWRKCLARSRPWPAGLAVFCPPPMLRKSPGRSAREASQGPGCSRHAVDNSVSKVVMTVLRQMLTRVRRRVARKCAAASQACPGLVPLGAGAWSVAPGASRVPGLS